MDVLPELLSETPAGRAYAMLIGDPSARFLWMEIPAECPPDALGFYFDGATFTHVGDRVSFEVLLASIGLAKSRGLPRLGALAHGLDMREVAVPEAAGLEAMLAGAQAPARR